MMSTRFLLCLFLLNLCLLDYFKDGFWLIYVYGGRNFLYSLMFLSSAINIILLYSEQLMFLNTENIIQLKMT